MPSLLYSRRLTRSYSHSNRFFPLESLAPLMNVRFLGKMFFSRALLPELTLSPHLRLFRYLVLRHCSLVLSILCGPWQNNCFMMVVKFNLYRLFRGPVFAFSSGGLRFRRVINFPNLSSLWNGVSCLNKSKHFWIKIRGENCRPSKWLLCCAVNCENSLCCFTEDECRFRRKIKLTFSDCYYVSEDDFVIIGI